LPEPLLTDQRSTGFPRVNNGRVEIGAYELQLFPTAANVSVAGQVTDEIGTPISRVTVTLTDLSGNIRQTTTNQFGHFSFEDVAAGETYIAQAIHKKYTFSPRVVSVAEDISDLNFTAGQEGEKR
jgi:hypothetical protein